MEYSFFLQPLFSSFIVASLLLVGLVLLSKKIIITNPRSSLRHIHKFGASRLGGVALIVAFIFAVVFDGRLVIEKPLLGILLALIAILIFGVIDDIKQLGWKMQLLFQFLVVVSVCFLGVKLEYISNPFGGIILFDNGQLYLLGFLISVIWTVFLMNVMNWVDGVDGVSGGITLIAVVVIFFLSQKPEVNQPPIGIITAALSGSLIAFLIYNFNPAKIIAGTSGSMFMGFMLAVLGIFAGAKIATTLMVLAVPVIDAIWVISERLRMKKSIFIADRRHLHYRLLELGWSVKKIFIFYFSITGVIAILALNMRAIGKAATMLIVASLMIIIMTAIAKRVGIDNCNHDEK